MKSDREAFCARLRVAMWAAQLSIEDLALETDIPERTLYSYASETSPANIPTSRLVLIADSLGVSIGWLAAGHFPRHRDEDFGRIRHWCVFGSYRYPLSPDDVRLEDARVAERMRFAARLCQIIARRDRKTGNYVVTASEYGLETVASWTKIPRATLCDYLNGACDIPRAALIAICWVTRTNLVWLATGEGPMRVDGPEYIEPRDVPAWLCSGDDDKPRSTGPEGPAGASRTRNVSPDAIQMLEDIDAALARDAAA